jgi:hypothetical protein
MFKHAYVRGIQTALVNEGVAVFPNKDTADKVADYIAARVDIDLTKSVPRETTHKIATDLVAASDWIMKQPGFKAASWNKLASWDDVMKLADENAVALMEKAAEGSTIEGGDKGNDEPQAPAGETKMDVKQRPPGYATDSQGKTEVDTKPGAVGKEEENPNAPHETDKKDNSPQEQSRTASATLASLFKAAEGSTIMGGDKGNNPTQVTHAEGKMDQAQRPVGYATFGTKGVGSLGEVMKNMTGPAVVGRETPNPNAPAETDKKTNSPQQTSAKAAEEDPYLVLFKKTATEIHEYLPATFDENAKIATVRACMGLTTEEKAHYLRGLQKEAAEKTAATPAAVPPGSRTDNYQQHSPEATHSRPGAYDGRKGNQGTKTGEEGALPPFMKKDEKKDDDGDKDKDKEKEKDNDGKKDMPPWMKEEKEKEASLRETMRRIEEAQRASS